MRCVAEWLPSRIDFGGWIAILVAHPDRSDRTPKVVKVLAFPVGDPGIGERGLSQRIHASRYRCFVRKQSCQR